MEQRPTVSDVPTTPWPNDISSIGSETKPYANEEPSAEMKTAASLMRELFVSLVQAGFTEMQALKIIAIGMHPPKEADE